MSTSELITVYWRPGCPFCARLRRDLKRRGIQAQWRNIWADSAARQFVRSANRGDETVPTVVVDDWVRTNPSGRDIAEQLAALGVSLPERRPWWRSALKQSR